MTNIIQETHPCSDCLYHKKNKDGEPSLPNFFYCAKGRAYFCEPYARYREEEGTCFKPSLESLVLKYSKHIGVKELPLKGPISDRDARFELLSYWSILFGLVEKIEKGDFEIE